MKTAGIALLFLAITVNALPEPMTFDPAAEAKATVDSLLQEGKDMGACASLASTTIKEVEDSVSAQQSILDALDTGDKCPLKGQAAVDAANQKLQDATQDKADADAAYAAAQTAPVTFAPKAFNSMDKKSCSIFTEDAAYIAAVGAKDRAKKSADQAAGAVQSAEEALDAAKAAQEELRKECFCAVRANYNKAWSAATANNDANKKAYTKGKHMQCVLDGKAADACEVGPVPEVKEVKLADGVPAQVCNPPTPTPTPQPTPQPTATPTTPPVYTMGSTIPGCTGATTYAGLGSCHSGVSDQQVADFWCKKGNFGKGVSWTMFKGNSGPLCYVVGNNPSSVINKNGQIKFMSGYGCSGHCKCMQNLRCSGQ